MTDEDDYPLLPLPEEPIYPLPGQPVMVMHRCAYCLTPFKHPVLPEGKTAACPECGASDSSGHRALPEVETLLTKPGTGFQLLNAATGKEIMVVRCLCGHLFDFPRWEVGKCPACEREFLIPPPPEADQDRWMTDPRDEGA
jgi:hypothetical protein